MHHHVVLLVIVFQDDSAKMQIIFRGDRDECRRFYNHHPNIALHNESKPVSYGYLTVQPMAEWETYGTQECRAANSVPLVAA